MEPMNNELARLNAFIKTVEPVVNALSHLLFELEDDGRILIYRIDGKPVQINQAFLNPIIEELEALLAGGAQ